jgi:type VI secretion system secreted protein VgrG
LLGCIKTEPLSDDLSRGMSWVKVIVAEITILKCGQASIILKKNGDISITGNEISIKASGDIVLKGQKILQN